MSTEAVSEMPGSFRVSTRYPKYKVPVFTILFKALRELPATAFRGATAAPT
jgi:hypothetical protein